MKKSVFFNDLTGLFKVYGPARILLTNVKRRVSKDLYSRICNFLIGLDNDMQLELADYMLDEVMSGHEHYTGIEHIDENLKSIYLRIDKELGRI